MMKKNVLASAITFSLFAASAQAASLNRTLDDQVSLRFGPFFPAIDTKVSINGDKYDFENVLDDKDTTAALKGLVRITPRFRFNFGVWSNKRDATDSLGQNENIGGITIPAGSSLTAIFESRYLNGSIGYSFIRSDTTEFGADIGITGLKLKASLRASVPGSNSVSFTALDETYPLPTIGLYLNQALSPTWSVSGRFGAMGLNIGNDFEGTVTEANAAVEFRPWQNFGLGLAYLYNKADATLNNVDVIGGLDVDWKYQGPFAYLTLGFGSVSGK